jgi:hypothetical protein
MFPRVAQILTVIAFVVSPLCAQKANPISFRLLATSANVCVGKPTLELEAVLTNQGDEELIINADGLDHHVDLARYDNGAEVDSQHLLKEMGAYSWQHIGPHQSIIVSFAESLSTDGLLMHKFDSKPGLYEIRTRYSVYAERADASVDYLGNVLSNGVFFLLSSCKKESGNAATSTETPPRSGESSTSTLLHESGHVADPPKQP